MKKTVKNWQPEEIRELKAKARKGFSHTDIYLNGRSRFSIRYKFYDLGCYSILWSKKEIRWLKEDVKKGIPFDKMRGKRTPIAKRNKAIRLGIYKTKKKKMKSWRIDEIKLLRHLVTYAGYTARSLVRNQWFPGRTLDSIAQQISRQKIKSRH